MKLLETVTVRAQLRRIEDKRPTCLEVLGSSLLPVEMTGEYFPRFTDEQELETCLPEWYGIALVDAIPYRVHQLR